MSKTPKDQDPTLQKAINEFHDKLWTIGNHNECGLFADTFEDRFNELLAESNVILDMRDITRQESVSIKCWQFWIVGFMTSKKLQVKPENRISSILHDIHCVV
jgi:hypothetical protein